MVLHVIASNFFGGPEKQILTHLVMAKKREFPIGVCVFAGKGMNTELAESAASLGIPSYRIETDSKFDMRSLLQLRGILAENNVRLVCSHGFKADFYSFAVSKLRKIRRIAFVRGDTSENLKVRIYNLLDRSLLKGFDRIITLSHAQQMKLERLGIPPSSISVVQNAIDVEKIRNAAEAQTGDLGEFGGENRAGGYLVSVGRLSPEKGHAVLIDAMREVVAAHPEIRLLILGDGQERPDLEGRVRKLGLERYVLMPGFSRAVPYYLKRSRLLVNPSFSEGMPNAVLEARALCIPVVATDVGGVSEIVSKELGGGLLVPPGDAGALAGGINKMLDSPESEVDQAKERFEEFRVRFGTESQTRRLMEIYSSVN